MDDASANKSDMILLWLSVASFGCKYINRIQIESLV